MIKRMMRLCILMLTLIMFTSCGYEKKIVGTWVGEGYFDSHGEDVPFEYVEQLTFTDDGSGYALGEGKQTNFTYKLTDDTLTLIFEELELAWGRQYEIHNDTLTVGAGEHSSVFTKIK
ncbi:MAG: hypothetical protein IJA85_02835 [Clostridia bacterium]|nr:hypothetical protein [Clostridia bacterium]